MPGTIQYYVDVLNVIEERLSSVASQLDSVNPIPEHMDELDQYRVVKRVTERLKTLEDRLEECRREMESELNE